MNQIIITGNLGKDAEKTQYEVRFTVATTRNYKDKNGEWQEKTTWHNVSYKGKEDYVSRLKKGDRVCVIGEQENGSFTKQDGSYGNYNQITSFEVYVQPKAAPADDMPGDDLPAFMR